LTPRAALQMPSQDLPMPIKICRSRRYARHRGSIQKTVRVQAGQLRAVLGLAKVLGQLDKKILLLVEKLLLAAS
jgi:hypothetical protein